MHLYMQHANPIGKVQLYSSHGARVNPDTSPLWVMVLWYFDLLQALTLTFTLALTLKLTFGFQWFMVYGILSCEFSNLLLANSPLLHPSQWNMEHASVTIRHLSAFHPWFFSPDSGGTSTQPEKSPRLERHLHGGREMWTAHCVGGGECGSCLKPHRH